MRVNTHMQSEASPNAITVGAIATALNVPLHRVLYILATRQHIRPIALAGAVRLFDCRGVAMVRHEINAIDARRCQKDQNAP